MVSKWRELLFLYAFQQLKKKFISSGFFHRFFYQQPHFRVEPRVAIKFPKNNFKASMKLLSIFSIEAQDCLIFDHFSVKCKKNKKIRQFLGKYQAQKLLRISSLRMESCWRGCYDRKWRVENGVACKKSSLVKIAYKSDLRLGWCFIFRRIGGCAHRRGFHKSNRFSIE